jgi:hypothetical protein
MSSTASLGHHAWTPGELANAHRDIGVEEYGSEGDLERKSGLIREKEPTTTDLITCWLRNVMNSLTGLDIMRGNLIKDVKVGDRIVSIWANLPENQIYAANIKEEVDEHISTLWDMNEGRNQFQ